MPGQRMPGGHREVIAITASTTLTNFDMGKVFTNRGAAGAVTITLPAPDGINKGGAIDVAVIANQTVTVTTSDQMVIMNDAAADSVSIETSNEKIGGYLSFISDGTSWLARNYSVGANTITTAT